MVVCAFDSVSLAIPNNMYRKISDLCSCFLIRIGALTKFFLFVLFTVAYVYVAYQSIPTKRSTSIKSKNITSKIIRRIEESRVDLYAIEEEMALRREQLSTTCQKLNIKVIPNTLDFIVDAHHSLVWCKVFKAASSTWIYYFNLLGGYQDTYLRTSKKNPLILLRSRFPRPTESQLNLAMQSSLSFLVVRDPFERLLSIYLDITSSETTKYYHESLNKIRNILYGKERYKNENLSFKEFVTYIVRKKNDEELWAPVHKRCAPCSINFTVIAKMETLVDDQEYIINRAGIDGDLNPTKVKLQFLAHRSRTKELLQKYYAQINEELFRKLINIYFVDFEMFGYNISRYYNFIKSTE